MKITPEQLNLCTLHGVVPAAVYASSKVGITLNVREGALPLHGLRHAPGGDTNAGTSGRAANYRRRMTHSSRSTLRISPTGYRRYRNTCGCRPAGDSWWPGTMRTYGSTRPSSKRVRV